MQGVIIISENTLRSITIPAFVFCMVVSVIGYIYFYFGYRDALRTLTTKVGKIIMTIFVIAAYGIVIYVDVRAIDLFTTYHTEYTVMIEDSVKYNEFVKNYDVIEKDGDYYVVKSKTE